MSETKTRKVYSAGFKANPGGSLDPWGTGAAAALL
jgi:hypothetical protein